MNSHDINVQVEDAKKMLEASMQMLSGSSYDLELDVWIRMSFASLFMEDEICEFEEGLRSDCFTFTKLE